MHVYNLNTGRPARGPGFCRLLNTSRAECWDGNTNRTDDIEDFNGDSIEDQGIHYYLFLSHSITSSHDLHSLSSEQSHH